MRFGSLADKSLVSVDTGGPSARYRLLDTTRSYARSKLQDAGESESMAQRHAGVLLSCARRRKRSRRTLGQRAPLP